MEICLGKLCNNRCVFCMSSADRDAHRPWLPPEQVKGELDHFHREGSRSVGFLGGEPTVYPHLLECVAYARGLGYTRIAVCSNGARFSDMAYCRALVEAGATRVTASIHSHKPKVEDGLITKIPGNLAKKVAGLRNLLALAAEGELKDGVSLNPVLCRKTLSGMAGYLRYFSAIGIRDIRFNYIWPSGSVIDDPEWIPSYREAMPHIARILILNERRLGLRLSFGGVPRCAMRLAGLSPRLADHLAAKYLDESAFDPDNDVAAPPEEGALPRRFVWQEHKRDNLKLREESCRPCRHYESCDGVWKTYASLHGLGELEPV